MNPPSDAPYLSKLRKLSKFIFQASHSLVFGASHENCTVIGILIIRLHAKAWVSSAASLPSVHGEETVSQYRMTRGYSLFIFDCVLM